MVFICIFVVFVLIKKNCLGPKRHNAQSLICSSYFGGGLYTWGGSINEGTTKLNSLAKLFLQNNPAIGVVDGKPHLVRVCRDSQRRKRVPLVSYFLNGLNF